MQLFLIKNRFIFCLQLMAVYWKNYFVAILAPPVRWSNTARENLAPFSIVSHSKKYFATVLKTLNQNNIFLCLSIPFKKFCFFVFFFLSISKQKQFPMRQNPSKTKNAPNSFHLFFKIFKAFFSNWRLLFHSFTWSKCADDRWLVSIVSKSAVVVQQLRFIFSISSFC